MNLIKKIRDWFLKLAIRKALGRLKMEPIFKWLEGKKTYLSAAIAVVLAGIEVFAGVKIPDVIYIILGALGLASLRDAVAKIKS